MGRKLGLLFGWLSLIVAVILGVAMFAAAEEAKSGTVPQKITAPEQLLSGWSLNGSQIILGFESAKTKNENFVFDRARLNFTPPPFTLWGKKAGARIAIETVKGTGDKFQIDLKYAYPWVEISPGLIAKFGYIEGALVDPEEMGLRGLGGHIGKSMVDTDLGVSSRRLGAGLNYALDAKSKISVIIGNGIFGDHSAEVLVDYYPFVKMSDPHSILKNFFVRAGALYDFGTKGETSLVLGRTGFYSKDAYEISVMALTMKGPATRLVGAYPGLKTFKDADISNHGIEILGRAYPFKLAGAENEFLKKAWLMGRVRDISGDFGYRNTALIVGYDITNSIRVNAGPERNTYSAKTGKADETRFTVGLSIKF
jgi:hypothetical protein